MVHEQHTIRLHYTNGLGQESLAEFFLVRQRGDLVVGVARFGDADMLDHAATHHRIKAAVGKRQSRRVRSQQAYTPEFSPLGPLLYPKARHVNSKGFESRRSEVLR